MRTVEEVTKLLAERYDGPTDQVQGSGGKMYTYVPWTENVRVLDDIFGPTNWSEEPVAFVVNPVSGAYTAVVKVTARAFDVKAGQVVEFSRAGFSTSTAGATRAEREAAQREGGKAVVTEVLDLHETAADGAASKAFGKACKKLGNAFALYLYTEKAPATSAPRQASSSPQTGGNLGPRPSDKQAGILRGKLGYTDEMIATTPFAEWKAAIDAHFSGGAAPAKPRVQTPADLIGADA